MPFTVTAPPPLLVTVSTDPLDCTPTADEPKASDPAIDRLPGDGGGPPVWPVPDIAMVCGLPSPFDAIVIVPDRAPATSGVNCTLIEHDDRGLTNAPAVQVLLTIENSAGLLLLTLEICTAALPMLETFFACTELPTPTV